MKKIISALLAASIIALPSVSIADTIYENNTKTTITEGISLEKVETFTSSGWIKANIVRVDLTDEDLELKVLTSPNGTSSLATVKTMAEESNTKVAVNADFFNMVSGETNMLGMVIKDGELISTPSRDNFVSFAITEENEVLFDYFTFEGKLFAEETSLTEYAECDLYQINKVPVTTGGITMITSHWGETVTVPEYTYGMICEPLGENEYIMTGFSWGGEKVTIPEDGAVFIADYMVNAFLNANFAIGDTIRVETTISPDIDSIIEASGGNTLIVKDGEIAPFTSDIAGKAQRTAMGLSPSGKTLVLVTIDGREEDCAGFTQTDLAEFMIALGCSDAINLDGGGSTTLVTPDRFTNSQSIQNSVSSQRKVSTAIGVISHKETGKAKDGEIKLSADTIIEGASVNVSYAFYDKYYNNVEIDPSDIDISCTDEESIIEGNRVTLKTGGTHTICAEYKGIELEASVTVLDDIFAINIYPEQTMTTSRDKTFMVTAYDKNGLSAVIPTELVQYVTEGEIIMEGATVKQGEAKGFVTAKYKDLTSVAVVNGEKYEREDDIREEDIFEGFIEDGERITITGKISESKNLIGRFQVKAYLSDLVTRGDVYALSNEVYDPWGMFTVYRKTDGYTERVIENTRIVTIANEEKNSIRLTQSGAWENLKYMCENIQEENVVLILNEPVYNLNSGEVKVWNHFMDILTEKNVNVFVVAMGEKSEVTAENGVRYLYVGPIGDCVNASFDYGFKNSAPLTFSFKDSEIKYTFG